MTTYIAFTPNRNGTPPFTFSLTMDSKSYTGTVTWNFAAQRWYLTITDSNGNRMWTGAMVGSPLGYDIYLSLGIFETSTILYREDTGNIEINP
jgi:hypothetical protein